MVVADCGDRHPPYNLEAESGVIGSVLLDWSVMDDLADLLTPDDFFRAANQVLWAAMIRTYRRGEPVDAVTLADELTRDGTLGDVGGVEYLAELVNGVPHALNARYYASIVLQRSRTRAVMEGAARVLELGYGNQHTAEQILEEWQSLGMRLSERSVGDETVAVGDVIGDALTRLERRGGAPSGLTSGWAALDQLGDGFQGGQMVVIAARPSMGKTALAMNLIERFALDLRVPTLFFNLEMPKLDLAERLVVTRSGVWNTKFKNPALLTGEDYHRISRAWEEFRRAKLFVNDVANRSVLQLTALARRYKSRHGVGAVVVDYLQLLSPENERDGRQEQVARMSRALKILARDLDVPVFVISQLNRSVENREDKTPRMADLRESGAIEADADVVILVHRPDYYDPNDRPGQVDLVVAKNRSGATARVALTWQGALYKFSDGVTPDAAPEGAAY
jgi:replicative DNA helicase